MAQTGLKELAKEDKVEVVEQYIGEVGYPAYHCARSFSSTPSEKLVSCP